MVPFMRPKDLEAAAEFGLALSALNQAIGNPRPGAVVKQMFAADGTDLSDDTITNAMKGQTDPRQCSMELLLALLRFYACPPEALGPVAAERLHQVVSTVTYASRRRKPERRRSSPAGYPRLTPVLSSGDTSVYLVAA